MRPAVKYLSAHLAWDSKLDPTMHVRQATTADAEAISSLYNREVTEGTPPSTWFHEPWPSRSSGSAIAPGVSPCWWPKPTGPSSASPP